MLETKVLNAIGESREDYLKLLPHISPFDFTSYGRVVLEEINKYYTTDDKAGKVDFEIILERISKKFPDEKVLYETYLSWGKEPASTKNVLELLLEFKKDHIIGEILACIGGGSRDKIKPLMESYLSLNVLEEEKQEVFNAPLIEELEKHFTGTNLIPIFPSAISNFLGGGVPRQSQLCIFARPDVGKTTVAINMAVGAAQSGCKVLYIGNEDPAVKMMYRMVTRFVKQTEQEIKTAPKKYFEEAMKNGYKNMFFVSLHPGTLLDIRKYVEQIRPDMLIVDQIRNLNIKRDSMTVNLEQAVIGLRNIAKEFNLVSVVVTQAGASAVNKLYLEMQDVEWSNTGVAAQMDLMIGVGQNPDLKSMNKIFLSFPKNKLCAPIQPFSATIEYALNRITT